MLLREFPIEPRTDEPRPPGWFSLRIGVPVAFITLGLGVGVLLRDRTDRLNHADVRLAGRACGIELVARDGLLAAYAHWDGGGEVRRVLAALDPVAARKSGYPYVAASDVRGARVVVDPRRHEVRFILARGEIVFSRLGFGTRGLPLDESE